MAGIVSQIYGHEISFLEWIVFGLPVSMLLLAICWVYLTQHAFTFKQDKFSGGREEMLKLKNELGVIPYEQKIVGIVFISVGFCWITRSFLLQKIFPVIDDAIIAIIFAMILFIINAKSKNKKILEWKEAVKMPWVFFYSLEEACLWQKHLTLVVWPFGSIIK